MSEYVSSELNLSHSRRLPLSMEAKFAHVTFFSTIFLQKFGFQLDRAAIFSCLPIYLFLNLYLIWTKRVAIRSGIIIIYMIFVLVVLVSLAISLAFPDPRVSVSLLSPIAIFGNYLIFLVGPNKDFNGREVIRVFVLYMRIIAIIGIAQYLLQFIGFSLFSFAVSYPELSPILVEKTWNYYPVVGYGSNILKSNGLFMLEPSIFSQFLVIAACVDYFVLNKIKFIPLYALAYLYTFSGTGALGLVLSIPLYIILFYRESFRLIYFAIAGFAAATVLAIAVPDQAASLARRTTEFQSSGSSGHKRFAGQFESLDAVLGEGRVAIGYGPGAMDRADFLQNGSGGLFIKLIVDYGIAGFLAFSVLIGSASWTWKLSIVPILMLMIFTFGGAYLVFSPLLITWSALCVWGSNNALRERK